MIRIQCCKEILTILKKCPKKSYRYISTGDESWILYLTPKGCMWIRSGQEAPKEANKGFQCPKVLLCIFWGPAGIASIKVLQKGVTLNSTLFISNVIKPIKHYDCFIEDEHDRKKFYIHYDYCPSHIS